MKNVLLCSGGLDSMIIHNNHKDEIDYYVYIKYRGDHPATVQELKILEEAGIKPIILEIDDLLCNENGYYFGRNLRFLLAVREYFIDEKITVFTGNTANDGSSDNTRSYFYKMEDIINNSYPNIMRIVCPLENRTKVSLIKEAKEKGIKFYFCDLGEEEPCMNCHSCKAMEDAGYFD